ncbi:MAG: indole-3-glycerol phosphate synthase TrpC [Bacteroidota bacterium]
MDILQRINQAKREEVATSRVSRPPEELERSVHFNRSIRSLSNSILSSEQFGIIAEFKRRSPSKGDIRAGAVVDEIVPGYAAVGAAAISVLTDQSYFGGSSADLLQARRLVDVPLLRKDFIVDEYQILEARALGADAILLIAASLTPEQLKRFTTYAHALGLEVLLEVHDLQELEVGLEAGADLIGVNNRNLKTFHTDLNTSRLLIRHIPASVVAIAESGIESPEVIAEFRNLGYRGFLIGQHFMQQPDPPTACQELIKSVLLVS